MPYKLNNAILDITGTAFQMTFSSLQDLIDKKIIVEVKEPELPVWKKEFRILMGKLVGWRDVKVDTELEALLEKYLTPFEDDTANCK